MLIIREWMSFQSFTSRCAMSIYPSAVMNVSVYQDGRRIFLMLMCDISLMACGGCEQLADLVGLIISQQHTEELLHASSLHPPHVCLSETGSQRKAGFQQNQTPPHSRNFPLLRLSFCLSPTSSALFLQSNTTDSCRCRGGNSYPPRC